MELLKPTAIIYHQKIRNPWKGKDHHVSNIYSTYQGLGAPRPLLIVIYRTVNEILRLIFKTISGEPSICNAGQDVENMEEL